MLRRFQIAALGSAIAAVTLLHHSLPESWTLWHNVLQHLYVIPVVIAGICFGWTGGVIAAVAAALCYTPHVLASARSHGYPGYLSSQVAEFGDFVLAGIAAGLIASRERRQKQTLERTTQQLQDVYRELQDNFDRMKRAERLYAIGQLSAGLAHEIRNPLFAISGAAGVLKRGQAPEDRRQECLAIIDKECQRLDSLLSNFLDFARPRRPRFQTVDIAALFESVASVIAHGIGNSKTVIRTRIAPGVPTLYSDPEQLKQVLLNIVINAVQAMPDGGEVLLLCRPQGSRIVLQVRDQGCGIAPENVDKVFDPFFTTKENGTGLGLSVAHQITGQLGGMLTLEPNPDCGTTFSILLPPGTGETS